MLLFRNYLRKRLHVALYTEKYYRKHTADCLITTSKEQLPYPLQSELRFRLGHSNVAPEGILPFKTETAFSFEGFKLTGSNSLTQTSELNLLRH